MMTSEPGAESLLDTIADATKLGRLPRPPPWSSVVSSTRQTRFAGRTAVVTGAASGIGRATAERLRDEGAAVLAVDRNEQLLATLDGCEQLAVDLSTLAGVAAVAAAVEHPDLLVNAAGVLLLRALDEVDEAAFDAQVAVNLKAVFFLSQALCPRIEPGGAVVNLSSTSAQTGSTLEAAVYAATKAGVLSLTRAFAHASAPRNVRVNAIVPGIVDTPMQDAVLEQVSVLRGLPVAQLAEDRLKGVPMARSSSAAECAGLIAFLLSDDAGYLTGQTIDWSGGLVMR
jgi:NAD(P)-dependent dehydrogenase (short-subunit alcohol dehydrogenase family)